MEGETETKIEREMGRVCEREGVGIVGARYTYGREIGGEREGERERREWGEKARPSDKPKQRSVHFWVKVGIV